MTLDLLSDIVVYSKYAKYIPQLQRRETWTEVVGRYLAMMVKRYPHLREAIETHGQLLLDKRVLPSMRALQFAGAAIEKNEARIYNCSYLPIDHYKAFSEVMFLLLGGTGVGYSVQQHHIEKLPSIQHPTRESKYLIGDSIEGWADAVKQLMKAYLGETTTRPRFDYTDIRPKGSRLVTAGGKAPGPEPLKNCLQEVEMLLMKKANGSQLTSTEVHDILCHIADAVLAGGIRRAAMISLFSFDDDAMRGAKGNFQIHQWKHAVIDMGTNEQGEPKSGIVEHISHGKRYYDLHVHVTDSAGNSYQKDCYWVSESDLQDLKDGDTLPWYYFEPQRGRANNSATILRNRVKKDEFDTLWATISTSGSGEPGVYFTNDPEYGTNPCCEISLRPFTFCNLTEINAGTVESQEDLLQRAKVAAFFGTLQAGFTDFHYLRPVWQKNTEKDALVGVGMTGICNGNILDLDLRAAADIALYENARVADLIEINEAARVTTVKPSGTSSCVVGTSSGIHAWHAPKYIRNMQCKVGDDLYQFFTEHHPELIKNMEMMPGSAVIGVPQLAPDIGIVRYDETAIDMLERVKRFNLEWVKAGHRRGPNTNNVSATCNVKENEWDQVGEWMWNNKHTYNGLSVLPFDGGNYSDAPFEEVPDEVFERKLQYILDNEIDLTLIKEEEDMTTQAAELACAGGACETSF